MQREYLNAVTVLKFSLVLLITAAAEPFNLETVDTNPLTADELETLEKALAVVKLDLHMRPTSNETDDDSEEIY
jgi:hypothetical protein